MKRSRKILIIVIVFALLALAVKQFDLADKITIDSLRAIVDQAGPFGPLVFMLIYYIVTLLFISAAAFSVIGGLLFGKLYGTLYVIVAATASAQTAFLIGRLLGSDIISKLGTHGGAVQKLIERIRAQVQQGGFQTFVIMRCLFLPYIPVSYAAGLVKEARGKDFFWATLLTNLVFSPAYVFFGDSLLKGPKALILPVLMIMLVLSVPKLVRKFRKQQ